VGPPRLALVLVTGVIIGVAVGTQGSPSLDERSPLISGNAAWTPQVRSDTVGPVKRRESGMIYVRMPYARRVLAGVAAALSIGLVGGLARPAPAAAATAEVGITDFRYNDSSLFDDYFFGYVKSPRTRCKENREVKVFRVRRGDDARVGSDRTNGTYAFQLNKEDARDGRYYAKVNSKPGCKGARSTAITVDDNPQQ